MKKKLLAVGMFVLTFLAATSTAHAVVHYTLGYSSVDENEIRWGGGSKYAGALANAIAAWNARGRVNIAPDTAWTYEDLHISDVNSNVGVWNGVTGMTTPYAGTDTLKINTFYLDPQNNSRKQNTITHELGHSLGIAHSPITNPVTNIMAPAQSEQMLLGPQDISDYRFLWGG